jgi:D-alanyl-D-alanine-carboxypeptidase/D-alanyl-D-alanine-endopeptidase
MGEANWMHLIRACALWTAVSCTRNPETRVAPEASATVSRTQAEAKTRERNAIAAVLAPVLAEQPGRAAGVMMLDRSGPRFHTFGVRSLRDGAALDADTTFEIGSLSKVFAGVLLAEAELRAEIALDDPLAKYLPDWTLPERDGAKMTLRQAATHTTGLPWMPDNWVKTSGGVTRYSEAMLREYLAAYTLPSAPGELYQYSNVGSALLARALANRAGRSYPELLEERIFAPLGMRRSGYANVMYRVDANMLDGYEEDDTLSVPRIDVSPIGPSCAIRSSLYDIAQFAGAALDPRSPLAPAFARASEAQRAIDPRDPESRWIALGWELDRKRGALRKNGQVSGYRCELLIAPFAGRGLFLVVNSMRAPITRLSNELWDAGGG